MGNIAIASTGQSGSADHVVDVGIDSSRVVPTGNENSPRTAAVRRWCRVA